MGCEGAASTSADEDDWKSGARSAIKGKTGKRESIVWMCAARVLWV